MVKKFVRKSGLSPVVTTVLLITLTIAIIVIIFFWIRGMMIEPVTKFEKNIQLACKDVDLDISYSSGTLSIINNGMVPIYRINVKTSSEGSYQTKEITEIIGGDSWPSAGLPQGGIFSGNIGSDSGVVGASEISISPILIGTSSKGKRTFVCVEQYGVTV